MNNDALVLGCDVSLNHSGFVMLDADMKLVDWYGLGTVASALKTCPNNYKRYVPPKTTDKHIKAAHRLHWLYENFHSILNRMKPTHIIIEGYAFDTHGAHQMGEVGGIIRYWAWKHGLKQRWHDPLTVKMYMCHKGNASKSDMKEQTVKRYPDITSGFKGYIWKQGLEDLYDATTLAIMGVVEHRLRVGDIKLYDLHPKEIKVFTRTTKAAPIQITKRGWITP